MKHYSNTSPITGKPSGVRGYDYDRDSVTVYFTSGAVYHYTVDSCGSSHIENIKRLADAQSGLNTYLTRNRPPQAWNR